mmetsp:Transcript_16738/g.34076  ORF Transcript_16738/g.34076 Transcript_16738/m.34076 type:complete len:220 (+) Transcript_16738:493-1152(+)
MLQGVDSGLLGLRARRHNRGDLHQSAASERRPSWMRHHHDDRSAVTSTANQRVCIAWLRIQDGARHALLLGRVLQPPRARLLRGRHPRPVPLLRGGGLRGRALPLLLLLRPGPWPALLGERLQGRARHARLQGRRPAPGVPPLRRRRVPGRQVPRVGGPHRGQVQLPGQARHSPLLGPHLQAGHRRLLGRRRPRRVPVVRGGPVPRHPVPGVSSPVRAA